MSGPDKPSAEPTPTPEPAADAPRPEFLTEEFIRRLAHDLRSPLSTITLWARLLRASRDDPARTEEAIAAIIASAAAQGRIIDAFADAAAIAAGRLHPDLRVADLALVLAETIDDHRAAIARRGLTLKADIADDLGAVIADPRRLRQIVESLLRNAVMYTQPDGAVRVVALRDGERVRIEIADTGAGIPTESLPDLFERLRRPGVRFANQGGLGLGLAISRELVEMHRGAISAASDGPGKGTTVRVDLRLPAIDEAPLVFTTPRPAARALPGRPVSGASILVVGGPGSLPGLLRALGAVAQAAPDLDAAREARSASSFDLVLVCPRTPGADSLLNDPDGAGAAIAVGENIGVVNGRVDAVSLAYALRAALTAR